jgi:hypothetical protein
MENSIRWSQVVSEILAGLVGLAALVVALGMTS